MAVPSLLNPFEVQRPQPVSPTLVNGSSTGNTRTSLIGPPPVKKPKRVGSLLSAGVSPETRRTLLGTGL